MPTGRCNQPKIVSGFTGKISHPLSRNFPHLDPSLTRAATIAEERAHAHSRRSCWRYVKNALLASGAVDSYPKTALARQAGDELVQRYGFKRLAAARPLPGPGGLGSCLWIGPRGRPCGDSHRSRFCERFPGVDAIAPAVDWHLREGLLRAGRFEVLERRRHGDQKPADHRQRDQQLGQRPGKIA